MVPPGRWSSSSALRGGWGLVVARCLGARGFRWRSAGGARPRCGVGHGGFAAVGKRARCRVHVQHPWPPLWGVLPPPPLVWGVAAPSFGGLWPSFLLVGGVLGSALPPGSFLRWGLWWLWWVVCDLYSGCEHLCCLRASPFLFRLARVRGACGGACGPRGRRFVVVVVGVFFVVCGFVGHSVDALAPRADEGRCGLRYAPGSWRASFDPGVSEWGNPARVVLGHHHLNVYRVVGGTRGSETSQYP